MTGNTTNYLLDTNVVSEQYKSRPNPNVLSFFQTLPVSRLSLSVMTLGELRKGAVVKRKSDPSTAMRLSIWIDALEREYSDRILDVDRAIATIWGEISADRTRPFADTLLAATAIVHNLILVTRNTADFAGLAVKLLNPWIEPQAT